MTQNVYNWEVFLNHKRNWWHFLPIVGTIVSLYKGIKLYKAEKRLNPRLYEIMRRRNLTFFYWTNILWIFWTIIDFFIFNTSPIYFRIWYRKSYAEYVKIKSTSPRMPRSDSTYYDNSYYGDQRGGYGY